MYQYDSPNMIDKTKSGNPFESKTKHFILMLFIVLISFSCSNSESTADAPKQNNTLPYIKTINGVKQLIVNDEPIIILGGELLNSSSSSIAYMKPIWPHLKAMNINTVLMPISWQQFEKQEGVYDYTLVDSHIKNAHQNDLFVIFLWFGSWKNGESNYTPDWVKTDMERFPRMRFENGKLSKTISNLSRGCLAVDKKAYLKFVERIAEVDVNKRVIMLQIENEVGLLGDSRDYSEEANNEFNGEVPRELIEYINDNLASLKPIIRSAYEKQGKKTSGSWEEVFGKSVDTDEMFMAWNYATYINELSVAGKAIHNIPTFVNAWSATNTNEPGFWPSGGPNYRMLDIWQAAAPDIDILAIDNYEEAFDAKCREFVHNQNPLFIPEAVAIWKGDTLSAGAKAFYTVGHYHAMCFSPFGIDHPVYYNDHPLKLAYSVLSSLMPLMTKAQAEHKINAFMEYDTASPSSFILGDYQFTAHYRLKKRPHIKGFGMVIQTADDEFVIAGNAFQLVLKSVNSEKPNAQMLLLEEGKFVNGKWQTIRVLNGDEFVLKLPAKPYDLVDNLNLNEISILKARLFSY